MSNADWIDTGIPTARIAALSIAGPAALAITWADGARAGRTEIIDLMPIIGAYKVYWPLRGNRKFFATARLTDDGSAVAWDGLAADMCAETIAAHAEQRYRETA